MKKTILLLTLSFCCMIACAQDELTVVKTHKIAVFAPLHLDSVFKDNKFKYKNNFPRFVVPGLDFVQGIKIAMDSFPAPIGKTEVFLYDSKADSMNIPQLIQSGKLDSVEMLIASIKDKELLDLSDYARNKKIPLFSVTYPNDMGITNNPYFIIANSTLKTHCEAIFSNLLQSYDTCKIILVRKTGSQEDRITGYFNNINKQDNKNLLNIKTITLDSNYNLIKSLLDSTKKNIVIGASLDESFAGKLTGALKEFSKKYNIMLIGMPNWEGFETFGKNNSSPIPLYFTSPYYHSKNDTCSKVLLNAYNNLYKGKPSEYAFKGFETIYVFSRLLQSFPEDIINHINDNIFKLFTDFNFMRVRTKDSDAEIDYYENKHLYLLNRKAGVNNLGW